MYLYKRQVGKLPNFKDTDFYISNAFKDTCTSLNANFGAYKPYNGLYIKNNKILLENLIEEIELKDKIFNMSQLKTALKYTNCDEYISLIDLDSNTIKYDVGDVLYQKQIYYENKSDILCIDYEVENKSSNNVLFRIKPLVTYRNFFVMKDAQYLRFTQRKIKDGMVLNISVSDDINLYIKSDELSYDKETKILTSVKHEYMNLDSKPSEYKEDLFLPGVFEIKLKKQSKKSFHMAISMHDFDISTLSLNSNFDSKVDESIPTKYQELRDLKQVLDEFEQTTKIYNKLPMLNSIKITDIIKAENIKYWIEVLSDNVKSIPGKYLIFERLQEANTMVSIYRRPISDLMQLETNDEEVKLKIIELLLWYVEIINKLVEKQEFLVNVYFDFIKNAINYVLLEENQKITLFDFVTCSLTYNAIKIYESLLLKQKKEDKNIKDLEMKIRFLLEQKYLSDDKKKLKRKMEDVEYSIFPEMIYSLSLSYPCFVGESSIKLLDTIFKELYTPYGLRKLPKSDKNYNGNVYPKYMAHFIKANLRQNGVTLVSKKIAFNLVKELTQDISKKVNGGVRSVYNSKGIHIDEIPYDLITIAEVARMYDMLT